MKSNDRSRMYCLLYMVLRAAMDFLGFFMPGIVDVIQRMGWDVNGMWVRTVHPATLTLLILYVLALKEDFKVKNIWRFLLVSAMPLWWATVLFTLPDRSSWQFLDACTWSAVALCALWVFIVDREWKSVE